MIMGLNGTYFAYQNANWNVIGLTTPGGDLAEEYNYTPYGRQLAWRHTGHADGDADSDVDSADITAYSAAVWTVKGEDEEYDRDFDADYDGDVDGVDITAFSMAYSAAGDSLVVCNRAWSPNQNPYGFTTRRLDTESLLMHYRARTYNADLKQFMQRDPLGYRDSATLYAYVAASPMMRGDPSGKGWTCCTNGVGKYQWIQRKPSENADNACNERTEPEPHYNVWRQTPHRSCVFYIGMPPGISPTPPITPSPFPSRPPGFGNCWKDCMAQNGCGTVIGGVVGGFSGGIGICVGMGGAPIPGGVIGAAGTFCTVAAMTCSLYCIGA